MLINERKILFQKQIHSLKIGQLSFHHFVHRCSDLHLNIGRNRLPTLKNKQNKLFR